MSKLVVHGAVLRCSQGMAPAFLSVLSTRRTTGEDKSVATILDHAPGVNIGPFGMCRSAMNPTVASATAAAGGTLTPQPCLPATSAPWSPGELRISVGSVALLDTDSTCRCVWGGTVSIVSPGALRSEAT